MTPSRGIEPTADPCLCFQNQLILGVMGIDVALNDIKRLTPNYTVSVVPLSISLLSLSCGRKPGSAAADQDPTALWGPLSSGSQGRLPEETTLGLELEWANFL